MKRHHRMSKGSQRASFITQRNSRRRDYEFYRRVERNQQKRLRGTKRSSTKYSSDISFTKILKALWNLISKIIKIF